MSLKPYRVTVSVTGAKPRTETIDAKTWAQAWLMAVEQYGNTCRVKVSLYYTVMSDGEDTRIVSELDLDKFLKEGYTPRSREHQFDSWLEARSEFGFELTPTQQRLLEIRSRVRT